MNSRVFLVNLFNCYCNKSKGKKNHQQYYCMQEHFRIAQYVNINKRIRLNFVIDGKIKPIKNKFPDIKAN
jgi:hypothetical protein